MRNEYQFYGLYRSLEPVNVFPQAAWKIDNSISINRYEMLVEVQLINVNYFSFHQLIEETGGDAEKLKEKIIQIVNERGKLHNYVTGTGGILYGTVERMGREYPNYYNVSIGDEIILLSSLTAVPLKIEEILEIDMAAAQIYVKGHAVIFAKTPILRRPDNFSLQLLMSALDEMGSPARVHNILSQGDQVIVLGAMTRTGILCSFAARDKLEAGGYLIAQVDNPEDKEHAEAFGIFDKVIVADSGDLSSFGEAGDEGFDYVINCIDWVQSEMAATILAKNKGTIYFTGLGNDYKRAALIAEAIGKDVNIIIYGGYDEKHCDYMISLLNKYQNLNHALAEQIAANFLYRLKKSIEAESDKYEGLNKTDSYTFNSPAIKKTLANALKVAKYNCAVLITGESGAGKEVIANTIYNNSDRAGQPYVKINCASIPEHLLESELFGYEKGAFSGAAPGGKMGLWESAHNGMLFLDEIGELPLQLQKKLLRAIQENEIIKVGGTSPIRVNVRLIGATNRNLQEMVHSGEFRSDLYYRISTFIIDVPPLRERREDIVPLINCFVDKYNKEYRVNKSLDRKLVDHLTSLEWKGNVRELQNTIYRLFIVCEGNEIDLDVLSEISNKNNVYTMPGNSESSSRMLPQEDALPSIDLDEYLSGIEKNMLLKYKSSYKTSRKIAVKLNLSQSAITRRLRKYNL